MRVPKMTFIDYNMWTSLIEHIDNNISKHLYGLGIQIGEIDVVPSYPKSSNLNKPTIVIQKVIQRVDDISIGSVLGEVQEDDGIIYDVYGKEYSVMYQINIEGRNNYESSILTDAIVGVLTSREDDYDSSMTIVLKNFADKTQDAIGNMRRYGDIDINPLGVDEDEDYAISIRSTFNVIQSIIDTDQQFVDLRKPIKWVIKPRINKGGN